MLRNGADGGDTSPTEAGHTLYRNLATDDSVYGDGAKKKTWSSNVDPQNTAQVVFGSTQGDNISTGIKDDRVYGLSGADVVNTGQGNDYIEGGDGGDTLNGGQGVDILKGGDGSDTLNGDEGNDVLVGDAGGDIYVVDANDGSDVIQGTDHTGDSIQLEGNSLIGMQVKQAA